MDEIYSFGYWVLRRRKALDLTREELATRVGCASETIKKIERDERRPSRQVAELLAHALGVLPEDYEHFLQSARGERSVDGLPLLSQPPKPLLPANKSNSNLPALLTTFIGREQEQTEIIRFMAKNRLVTLTGTGGIGKSRLAIQVGFALLNNFPNGTWLVELAPLSDAKLMPQVIVNTLGLMEQSNRSPQTTLIDFLKAKKSLLILDNCEHLILACAQLVETLLHACPDLHILVSSRETLGLGGERVALIHSLTTIEPVQATLDSLSDFEAVQLFLERASSALPGFMLTEVNASAVAQVCYHLDGIPLALELAAARVKLMRVEEIAVRLYDRFRLLTGGAATALPHHQTLQAMIDWSYDFLSEHERVLLRRLSVFAGRWTLEAAERVCADSTLDSSLHRKGEIPLSFLEKRDGSLDPTVLDLLTSLVNKSLILAERKQGEETRYHMLETIRQYARDRLWAAGEGELMRQSHLAYCVELAERAEPNLRAFTMIIWMDRLETVLNNIRVALEWAQESDVEAQLRLASALLWFWHIRGHRGEGVDWLESALSIEKAERGDQPLTTSRAMIRGKALNASGILMSLSFNLAKGTERLEESLALFQKLGRAGKQGMAYALWGLAKAMPSISRPARNLLEESLTLFREIDDKFGVAECLMSLAGLALIEDNDYKQALILAEEHLALRREIGDQDGIATALEKLRDLAFDEGDYQRAITLHEESLAVFRKLGNKWAIGHGLSVFGDVLLSQGNYKGATKIYEEVLAFARDISDGFLMAYSTYSLAGMLWLDGNYIRANQIIMDSLTVFRDVGNDWMVVGTLHTLGDIALSQGDEKRATQWYETELAFSQEAQINAGSIYALGGLGKVAWTIGDYELAAKRFRVMLSMSQEVDDKLAIFYASYGLGRVNQSWGNHVKASELYAQALSIQASKSKYPFEWVSLKASIAAIEYYPLSAIAVINTVDPQMERAARLLGALEPLYELIRWQLSPIERAEHDQAIATARAALGEEGFATAWEDGKRMTLEEAVAFALGER